MNESNPTPTTAPNEVPQTSEPAASPTIKPTIGRRILFFVGKNASVPAGFKRCGDGAFDAGIVYVWNDSLVNLDVCDHHGNHHPFTSIPILNPGDDRSDSMAWAEWMPYQIGQAAKTEAVSEGIDDELDEIRDTLGALLGVVPEGWREKVLAAQPTEAYRLKIGDVLDGATRDPSEPSFALFVEDIARENHERWRSSADRSYSPMNKPWAELTDQERYDSSRTTAITMHAVAGALNAAGICQLDIIVHDSLTA